MTYEYLCQECNHAWEVEQRISDHPIKQCPACEKETAKRQINCTNFILVGKWFANGGY